jgi:hypothetical protein
MGDVDATVGASLGQLAVASGALGEPARARLSRELAARVRAGQPASLARLLLQAGMTAQAVQDLLVRGAHFPAVRCDACGASTPQAALPTRDEVACAACGSLVLGFAAYAARPDRGEDPDATPFVGPPPSAGSALPLSETERWRGVLPLPGAAGGAAAPRESAGTDRWPGVLPLPPPRAGTQRITGPAAFARTVDEEGAEDPGGVTMAFGHVLPSPVSGVRRVFPEEAPAPDPRAVEDTLAPQAERTIGFGEVFLLPGRSAPRTDAEVTNEMHTLVGMPVLPLPSAPPGPVTPRGFDGPAGFSASDAGGEHVTGFDPAGMTVPLPPGQVAALKQSLASGSASASASGGPAAVGPGPAPPPGKKTTTRRPRRPAAAAPASKARWLLVVVPFFLLAAVAGLIALRLTGHL